MKTEASLELKKYVESLEIPLLYEVFACWPQANYFSWGLALSQCYFMLSKG